MMARASKAKPGPCALTVSARTTPGGPGWVKALATLAAALLLAGSLAGPAAAAPGAHGPDGEHLDAPGAAPRGSGLARLPDGSVVVPKPAQRLMGLRSQLVEPTQAALAVELPGRVVVDADGVGRVQAAHGGRVEPGPQGLPQVGQRVRRGQLLAYVRHHPDPLARAAQQAQQAELRAQRETAEQRLQRLAGLEGTVPRREIDALRTEAAALAEREQRLAAGLAVREALHAPVDGVVSRADLAAGQVVEPRDVLVELIDPARLRIEASTADPALAARIEDAALPGLPGLRLRLIGAAPLLREGLLPLVFAVRTAPAPAGVPAAALPLAVGQPLTVVVRTRERIAGIVLPARALTRGAANEPVVWIRSGAERFIAQPVRWQPLDAERIVVTHGLGADNRVVVQGAGLLAQIR
jgi:hypothetical protein